MLTATKQKIQKSLDIRPVVQNLCLSALDSIETGFFVVNNRQIKIKPIDACRVFSELAVQDDAVLAIRNFVLGRLISAEKASPGSAHVVLLFLTGDAEESRRKRRIDITDLNNVLCMQGGNGLLTKSIIASNERAGISGNIEFKTTDSENDHLVVQKVSVNKIKCFLNVGCNELLGCSTKMKFVLYDGLIESASAIHGIMTDAAEDDIPILILCKTISANAKDDILRTSLSNKLVLAESFGEDDDFINVKHMMRDRHMKFVSLDVGSNGQITRLREFPDAMITLMNDREFSYVFEGEPMSANYRWVITLRGAKEFIHINLDRLKCLMGIYRQCAKSGLVTIRRTKLQKEFNTSCASCLLGFQIAKSILKDLSNVSFLVLQQESYLHMKKKEFTSIVKVKEEQ